MKARMRSSYATVLNSQSALPAFDIRKIGNFSNDYDAALKTFEPLNRRTAYNAFEVDGCQAQNALPNHIGQ